MAKVRYTDHLFPGKAKAIQAAARVQTHDLLSAKQTHNQQGHID